MGRLPAQCACPSDTSSCKTVIEALLPIAPHVSKSILQVWAGKHVSHSVLGVRGTLTLCVSSLIPLIASFFPKLLLVFPTVPIASDPISITNLLTLYQDFWPDPLHVTFPFLEVG